MRAGYVYLRHGELRHARAAARLRPARRARRRLRLRRDARGASVRRRSAALVLILALVGAGSKAGLVPLHVWLPLAHPAAPSHVSALMSGVMTKVAVYGFVRIVFDLLGPPAWWWSMVVLALGGITAVMGVLYALMQHDLKRLLAYHTVENIGIIFIGLGLALAFKAHGMPFAAALALTAGAAPRVQSFAVQEPAVLRRRRRAQRDRRARHGASRRPHPPHAADRVRVPGRLRGDLGAAAAQRLRLRMADLPGDPAQPATAVWGLKFLVPAVGALLALSAALAAACFVKAFGVTFLGRPRTPAAERAQETDRFSLAAMFVFAALCLLAGILPGLFIDALAPVVQSARRRPHAGADRRRTGSRSCRSPKAAAPTTGCWSSCSCVISGIARRLRDPSPRLRHGCAARPAWDCGYPDREPGDAIHRRRASPSRSAACSAPSCSARASIGEMPPPGDTRAGAAHGRAARSDLGLRSTRRSPPASASPPSGSIACSSSPSASYLSSSSAALVVAAPGARDMAVIRDLAVQGAQMLLVLLLAPLLTGFVRKVKARLLRRQGPPLIQPYRDLVRLMRKEVVLADNASWLFRVIPYLVFAATWVAASLVPTFRDRPAVLLVGRSHRHHRAARQRALLPGARRPRRRHQLRRHRLEPRGDDRLARRAGDADDRVHAGADRRLDPALHHGRLHGFGRGRLARLARAWR